MSWTLWLFVAALFAATAIGFGAFGAHALKQTLQPEALVVFEVAARYQMYHALALVLVSLLILRVESRFFQGAAICFSIGTLVFSGSLYVVAIWGLKQYGMYTPIGGVLFIVGWLLLGIGALSL